MAKRGRGRRSAKPKAVSYELIARDGHVGKPMYALLRELVDAHHEDLAEARIGLAWCTSWKPDVDGRVTLGKCKLASALDRELAEFDIVILLRKAFWTEPRVTDLQRRALLDHELHHAVLKFDQRGEPLEDERGRKVWRTRKHDIEEFTGIVERYGIWTGNLELFAKALDRARNRNADFWIGVGALQQLLARVGLTVPTDVVQSWNQQERQEAEEWARLREELRRIPHVGEDATPPACVAPLLAPALPLEETVAAATEA